MAKKSFVFYKGWKDAIQDLPDDIRLEVYDGIIEYAINGNVPMLKPMAKIAFNFIKNDLDRDAYAYAEKCAKNKDNAKKGGAPKGNKNAQKTTETTERLKKQPKQPYNDHDDDNDDDNKLSNSDELLCETSKPHAETIDYKSLVDFFNSETKGVFGIIQHNLSEKRKGLIRARIREHGKEAFVQAIKRAYQSDYLKSGNFNCTFDWIIRPTNFEKIISGNYDNKNKRNNTVTVDNEDLTRNIFEGYARGVFEKQQR